MTEWRFLAYDLRTEEFLCELQVQSWSSSDPLKGDGSWSATVLLDGSAPTVAYSDPLLDEDGNALLDEDGNQLLAEPTLLAFASSRRTTVADSTRRGRTVVVAERDGVPIYSGIVWRRRYQAASRMLALAGSGLGSYFAHWAVTAPLGPYTATDQFEMFRQFVAAVQTAPAGDIGIDVDSGSSGVVRDRPVFEAFSGKMIGELMNDLASVQNGFDWSAQVEYDAGVPVRRLRLFYPRRGRDLSATNLRFDAPGNAILFDVDEDASDMAVTVVALGAGDGADMLITSASRTDLIDAGWPGYRTTRAHKDVSVLATLAEHAGAAVDRLSGVDQENYSLQVDPNSVGQPFGAWTLGDDCVLVVADDPLYPAQDDGTPGLVVNRRVMQHDWRVTGSSEELIVTLGEKVIP